MNKELCAFFFLTMILLSGCTQSGPQRQTATEAEEAAILNLSILATDDLQIRRSTLFSGEMTRLTLNLINLADVYFNNIKAVLINADDLEPIVESDYIEFIQPNRSNSFEWELTAPRLGVGEVLVLNDITVRTYYETYSTALKTLLLREPGNREYLETFSESSKSPIKLYFDTSYESFPTLDNNQTKDFTVNLVLYNEYIGLVDYYDNSYYSDNYIKSIVVGIPKELIFYDALEPNTPWIPATSETPNLIELGIDEDSMEFNNYYYIEFRKIENYNEEYDFASVCLLLDQLKGDDAVAKDRINALIEMTTMQKRVLWMTKGFTKINVLRLGAPMVSSDTELTLSARIDYSYSQDFGGNGFGAVIYGTG